MSRQGRAGGQGDTASVPGRPPSSMGFQAINRKIPQDSSENLSRYRTKPLDDSLKNPQRSAAPYIRSNFNYSSGSGHGGSSGIGGDRSRPSDDHGRTERGRTGYDHGESAIQSASPRKARPRSMVILSRSNADGPKPPSLGDGLDLSNSTRDMLAHDSDRELTPANSVDSSRDPCMILSTPEIRKRCAQGLSSPNMEENRRRSKKRSVSLDVLKKSHDCFKEGGRDCCKCTLKLYKSESAANLSKKSKDLKNYKQQSISFQDPLPTYRKSRQDDDHDRRRRDELKQAEMKRFHITQYTNNNNKPLSTSSQYPNNNRSPFTTKMGVNDIRRADIRLPYYTANLPSRNNAKGFEVGTSEETDPQYRKPAYGLDSRLAKENARRDFFSTEKNPDDDKNSKAVSDKQVSSFFKPSATVWGERKPNRPNTDMSNKSSKLETSEERNNRLNSRMWPSRSGSGGQDAGLKSDMQQEKPSALHNRYPELAGRVFDVIKNNEDPKGATQKNQEQISEADAMPGNQHDYKYDSEGDKDLVQALIARYDPKNGPLPSPYTQRSTRSRAQLTDYLHNVKKQHCEEQDADSNHDLSAPNSNNSNKFDLSPANQKKDDLPFASQKKPDLPLASPKTNDSLVSQTKQNSPSANQNKFNSFPTGQNNQPATSASHFDQKSPSKGGSLSRTQPSSLMTPKKPLQDQTRHPSNVKDQVHKPSLGRDTAHEPTRVEKEQLDVLAQTTFHVDGDITNSPVVIRRVPASRTNNNHVNTQDDENNNEGTNSVQAKTQYPKDACKGIRSGDVVYWRSFPSHSMWTQTSNFQQDDCVPVELSELGVSEDQYREVQPLLDEALRYRQLDACLSSWLSGCYLGVIFLVVWLLGYVVCCLGNLPTLVSGMLFVLTVLLVGLVAFCFRLTRNMLNSRHEHTMQKIHRVLSSSDLFVLMENEGFYPAAVTASFVFMDVSPCQKILQLSVRDKISENALLTQISLSHPPLMDLISQELEGIPNRPAAVGRKVLTKAIVLYFAPSFLDDFLGKKSHSTGKVPDRGSVARSLSERSPSVAFFEFIRQRGLWHVLGMVSEKVIPNHTRVPKPREAQVRT